MGAEKKQRKRFRDTVGKTGAIAACVIAVLSLIFAASGLISLDERVNDAIDYPYTVTMLVNSATNAMSEMRVRVEQAVNYPTEENVADAWTKVDELVPALRQSLDGIGTKYLGPPQDAQEMQALADRILDAQKQAMTDPYDLDENLISMGELAPLYDEFSAAADRIADYAEGTIESLRAQADDTAKNNMVLMVVLAAVIICVSLYYQQAVNQKNKENEDARRDLADALAAANRANSAKKEFLSRMSHEIRTPMNTIIGMTAIAAHSINDPDKLENCFQKINFASRHLLNLLNDVLDMSAIESGKLSISDVEFDLKSVLDSISGIYYEQCGRKGLSFEVVLSGVTEERLKGDPLRLNQILLNLLSNALKFTPEGGKIRLTVEQKGVRSGRVSLCFTVADNGIGMTPEFQEKLFQPFQQEKDTALQYGGSGLGMAITHNIVTLLNGSIQIKSAPGEGTEFTVCLSFGISGEPAGGGKAVPGLRELQVLVVDDDAVTCEHTSLVLNRMGLHAEWVLTGAQAVEKVCAAHERDEDYDVCFIDWKMPEMDGIETTRRIRQRVGEETLIIIISAYDWREIEQEARLAGANAFVTKPMFQSAIYNALVAVFGRGNKKADGGGDAPEAEFSGSTVLLAEDNEINLEIATELLDYAGVKVVPAENGREAVERFTGSPEGTFDAVFLDIQMPEMDGYAAARAIRGSGRKDAAAIPIIAMTANAFAEDVAASRAAGMDDHISKPIEPGVLYRTLRKHLRPGPPS